MRTVAARTAYADGKLSLQDCAEQLACASCLVLFTVRSRRCFLERRGQGLLERCQFGAGEVVVKQAAQRGREVQLDECDGEPMAKFQLAPASQRRSRVQLG
jgi:hypothetical protein